MTRTEQAELNELHITPEQLEERRREVEAKLHAEPNGIESTRQRRTRSDKGVARGPKLVEETAPAGAINTEQKSKLLLLVGLVQQTTSEHMQALVEAERAALRMNQAQSEFSAYLNSLTT